MFKRSALDLVVTVLWFVVFLSVRSLSPVYYKQRVRLSKKSNNGARRRPVSWRHPLTRPGGRRSGTKWTELIEAIALADEVGLDVLASANITGASSSITAPTMILAAARPRTSVSPNERGQGSEPADTVRVFTGVRDA